MTDSFQIDLDEDDDSQLQAARSQHLYQNMEDEILTEPEMWTAIERDVGALPVYLKNILSLNGYNHLLSLEELDDHAIREIEQFAKDSMKNYVPSTDEFFYIFKKDPSQFRIVPGHKKLLLKLRERIRKLGVQYYKHLRKLSVNPPTIMQMKPELFYSGEEDSTTFPPITLLPGQNQSEDEHLSPKRLKRNHITDVYPDDEKVRLLVYNWYNKYTTTGIDMSSIGTVVCCTDDKPYGIVVCCVPQCQTHVRIGAERNKNGSHRWIISNYVKHFQKYHPEFFKGDQKCKIELS